MWPVGVRRLRGRVVGSPAPVLHISKRLHASASCGRHAAPATPDVPYRAGAVPSCATLRRLRRTTKSQDTPASRRRRRRCAAALDRPGRQTHLGTPVGSPLGGTPQQLHERPPGTAPRPGTASEVPPLCGPCLRGQPHAQVTRLVCTDCGKVCRNDAEKTLHSRHTGHTDYVDRVRRRRRMTAGRSHQLRLPQHPAWPVTPARLQPRRSAHACPALPATRRLVPPSPRRAKLRSSAPSSRWRRQRPTWWAAAARLTRSGRECAGAGAAAAAGP